jgi:hypothetical protein
MLSINWNFVGDTQESHIANAQLPATSSIIGRQFAVALKEAGI